MGSLFTPQLRRVPLDDIGGIITIFRYCAPEFFKKTHRNHLKECMVVLLSNSTVGITSVSCAPFFIGGCFFRGNGNNTHRELWREDGFKGALFCGNTRYCLGTWCCHLPDFFAVHFNILLLENIKRECVRELGDYKPSGFIQPVGKFIARPWLILSISTTIYKWRCSRRSIQKEFTRQKYTPLY